jgi:hypothetical protein
VANIQARLKMAAVVARMQHQRLPVQYRVLDTPTCREQAFGGQPLTLGFGLQLTALQPPQQKAHLLKVHQAARVVQGLGQVLALLFTLAATAARQCFKLLERINNVAVAVLVRLVQMV